MHRWCIVIAVLSTACSMSHGSDVDAGTVADAEVNRDADVPRDASIRDGDVAPRCEEVTEPCLRLTRTATVEVAPADFALLAPVTRAIAATPDGPSMLALASTDDHYHAEWRLYPFGPAGSPSSEPIVLGNVDNSSETQGDLASTSAGGSQAVWRVPLLNERGGRVGFETDRATIDPALEVVHQPSMHVIEDSERTYEGVAVVAIGRESWIASETPDGVVLGSDACPSCLTIPTSGHFPAYGTLHSAVIDASRSVVLWSELDESGYSARVMAAVVSASETSAPVAIFEDTPPFPPPAVAARGGEVYVASFERRADSLTESRIRMARLDATLHRIEPDRWLAGWGGLTPRGLALVHWRDALWALWRSYDPRFGSSPVLFASRLPDEDCGIASVQPLEVWAPSDMPLQDQGFVAVPDGDVVWLAVGGDPAPGNAALYRIESCD